MTSSEMHQWLWPITRDNEKHTEITGGSNSMHIVQKEKDEKTSNLFHNQVHTSHQEDDAWSTGAEQT